MDNPMPVTARSQLRSVRTLLGLLLTAPREKSLFLFGHIVKQIDDLLENWDRDIEVERRIREMWPFTVARHPSEDISPFDDGDHLVEDQM